MPKKLTLPPIVKLTTLQNNQKSTDPGQPVFYMAVFLLAQVSPQKRYIVDNLCPAMLYFLEGMVDIDALQGRRYI